MSKEISGVILPQLPKKPDLSLIALQSILDHGENIMDKKKVLVVILQQYADMEVAYISTAINILGAGKYEVKTVSLSKEYVQSIGGFKVMPDYDLTSVPSDYEAVVLVGGMAWSYKSALKLKPLVDDCLKKNRVLGGICNASAFLGTIGVLNGVKHTSNGFEFLKQWAGSAYTGTAKYVAKQAVRDGNIITANGTASLEFAKEILFALNIASAEKINGWYNFQKLGVYTAEIPAM